MAQPREVERVEAIGTAKWMREDEYVIDFEDPRSFTMLRWTTANKAHRLSNEDMQLADDVTTHSAFDKYVRGLLAECSNAPFLSSIQSLMQLHRPVWTFESLIRAAIQPDKVVTSNVWAMLYLNIKLSSDSSEKLKKTAGWMNVLRRKIELLNRCITSSESESAMRMEICEIFDPLFGLLRDPIIFLLRHHTEEEAISNWNLRIEPKIKEHQESLEATIKHLESMGRTSQVNRQQSARIMELGIRDRDIPMDGSEKAIFPVRSLPPFLSRHFTGRDSEIEAIYKSFVEKNAPRLRTYLIYGRRGIGKTQIALEYARRYERDYDAIFWVQCETSASLRTSFANIAVSLELDGAAKDGHFEENLMKVLTWLRVTKKKWLLIYDNAEREQLLKGYWPKGSIGSILLTSRSHYNFFEDEQREGETVPFLKPQDCWNLLMAHLDREWVNKHFDEADIMSSVEREAAKTLLERTGGLPLSIAHSATLIKDPTCCDGTSVVKFLQHFAEKHKTLPSRQLGERDPVIHALDTIWSIAFDYLTPNAKALLGVLALMSPDLILLDLFLPTDQSRLTEKLAFCKTDSTSRKTNLQTVINPSKQLSKALDELVSKHIVRKVGRQMTVHRTVQEAVNYNDPKDLVDSFDASVNLVYDAFPKQENGTWMTEEWSSCADSVQHAIHLANKYVKYTKKSVDEGIPLKDMKSTNVLIDLLANVAWYLFEIADYEECLNIVAIARGACPDKDSLVFAHLLNTASCAYFELNQLTPSREAGEIAKKIRMSLLPPDDPEVAIILANLGNVAAAKGRLNEAFNLFQEAATIREAIGDSAASMLGLTFLQLGRVHFLQKEYTKAYELYQKAEGVFMKRVGRQRVFTAYLHFAYGNLSFAQDDYAGAAIEFDVCRKIIMDYNPLHPLTGATCYKLATCEYEQDNHKKALNFLEKALQIGEVRSSGVIDGTIARVLWKKTQVLLDDPLGTQESRDYAEKTLTELQMRRHEIAERLGIWPDENAQDKEEMYDILVPGYFR